MNPEQRARIYAEKVMAGLNLQVSMREEAGIFREIRLHFEEALRAAETEATLTERQRCLLIAAEKWVVGRHEVARGIAEAIEARGEVT